MSAPRSLSALPALRGDSLLRGLELLFAAHGSAEAQQSLGALAGKDEMLLDALAATLPVTAIRAHWDDLPALKLPVLAFGEEGSFLITRLEGEVATVCYPLIGHVLLLRAWVEERWSGDLLMVGEGPFARSISAQAACAPGTSSAA